MQNMWKSFIKEAYGCCSASFWKLFAEVVNETTSCQDRVLTVVKKLIQQKRSWPQSTRTLRSLINRTAGNFWTHVTETHKIDVSSFGIPGCKVVEFTFVDPIFLWAQRCAALCAAGIKLHWDAKTLMDPETQEEMYGAGVQYGTLFRSAIASVPRGGKPALISLSWDAGNTGFGSRSTKPLCLQVMNCNSASPKGVALVGYIPHLEAPDAFKDQKVLSLAQRHVIQEAVGFVLRAIEHVAKSGFLATVGGSDMILFPRVGALPLDTPERADYFGLRSIRACGICRFRSGRSAARQRARRHDPMEIVSLYDTGLSCCAYMLKCAHICHVQHIYGLVTHICHTSHMYYRCVLLRIYVHMRAYMSRITHIWSSYTYVTHRTCMQPTRKFTPCP